MSRRDDSLMVGMRNRLVHVCFDIDLALLWTTGTADRQLAMTDGRVP